MTELTGSILSPKLVLRQHPAKGGYGLYATEPRPVGNLIAVWGGYSLTGEQFFNLSPYLQRRIDRLPPADDRRYPPGGTSPTVSPP